MFASFNTFIFRQVKPNTAFIINISNEKDEIDNQTYTSQPVLLKLWNTKHFSLPPSSFSDTHLTNSFPNSSIRRSSLRPRSSLTKSLTSTVKVTALIPLELYHSTYLLRCFALAPNHPRRTTVVSFPLSPNVFAFPSPFTVRGALFQTATPSLGWDRSGLA